MKINNVQNQPNFTSVYAKMDGYWENIAEKKGRAITTPIYKILNEAKDRLVISVNSNKAKIYDSIDNKIISEGVIQNYPVVLINESVEAYKNVKSEPDKLKTFLNNIFKNRFEFDDVTTEQHKVQHFYV